MKSWKVFFDQEGAVAIIVAICAVILLSVAAFVIDGGFGLVTRNELKNVADGAALAGTRMLGDIYSKMTPAEQQTYVLTDQHRAEIIAVVQSVAGQNAAGGKKTVINEADDIRIGDWGRWDDAGNRDESKPYSMKVTGTTPDAVEVTARRDETVPTGSISTFLARIMGVDSLKVTSTSANTQPAFTTLMRPTAALTGISKVGPGELTLPVGISSAWFKNQEGGFCGKSIQFSPTKDSCSGWNTFTSKTHSAEQLKEILQGLKDGTYESPEATAGETTFNFSGGEVTSGWDDFIALYDKNKDADGKWATFVPVYDASELSGECANPQNNITIVGFATANITYVCSPPDRPCDPAKFPGAKNGDKIIVGEVICNIVQEDSRGGGAEYGTKGEIPGLVQ
jgi:Flp pilus assembly protein TadG